MHNRPVTRACLAAAALAVACAALAAPGAAIVPPANCGSLTVKAKRYLIKADQLSCKSAKAHAKRYLTTHRRPSGYTCRDFKPADTSLKFSCERRPKVFFAIRR